MHDDTPLSRHHAARMIADYRPDHYYGIRFGDTVESPPNSHYIETVTDLVAVHIFNDKIIIVDADGNVTTYNTKDLYGFRWLRH